MNTNLLFEFSVDKENKTIHVEREFAADLPLVWDAWTKAELLDQWWAPKPYRAQTKSMDFKEGGLWLYAMISPENIPHWSRVDYKMITRLKSFSALDAFCNEHGIVNESFPRMAWTNSFSENEGGTVVDVNIKFNELSDLEKIIDMGFKEGFSMALANLDQYLEAQFKLRNDLNTNQQPRVCTYLNFPGNTEQAFLFYRSVFKTEFLGKGIQRFGDQPAGNGYPPIADSVKSMVLHIELPITGNHILMGTDAPNEMGFSVKVGNNIHIMIDAPSREEAKRLFGELSAGGSISMPLQDMFWGAYFGSFADKFGINWMINYQAND